MEGTVKWFSGRKGYGFIKGEDENEYFVHITQVPEGVFINEGDKVSFEAVETDKGMQAQEIEMLEKAEEGAEEAGMEEETSEEGMALGTEEEPAGEESVEDETDEEDTEELGEDLEEDDEDLEEDDEDLEEDTEDVSEEEPETEESDEPEDEEKNL